MSGDVYTLLYRSHNPFRGVKLFSSEGTLEELEDVIASTERCTFYGIYKKVMNVDTNVDVKFTKIEELL